MKGIQEAMTSEKKQTYFAPSIDKYFARWILREQWYTGDLRDETRFHEFVLAVHKLSKLIGGKSGMGKWARDEAGYPIANDMGGLIANGSRNPRTYDKESFKAKIIEAVKQNHPFNDEELKKLATRFANRAMEILDFLWQTRDGLPDLKEWNPPLRPPRRRTKKVAPKSMILRLVRP